MACSHCDAERAGLDAISFTARYALALISGITLISGIILQIFSFPPVLYYVAFLTSIFTAGRWIISNGIRSIINAHLGISFLITIAAFGATVIGEPAEGAAVMVLFNIAELLEARASHRVRTEIESLLNLKPESVNVFEEDANVSMHPEHVKIGQIFSVKPGERIGLDGRVIKGTSTVNQAPITGESIPVEKSIDDEVFAGTINIDGYLEVKVSKRSEDSVLSRIVRLVKEARESKSPTERFVSRFSHVYTPVIVFGSFILVVITFILTGSPIDAVYRGLTLLVISCPCAFAISIPVSMVSSIVGSAREGVLIKGSDHLEKLSSIETIAFDKTGTLTTGHLTLQNICLHKGTAREEVLGAAIALERMSEHLIAQVLIEAGREEGIEISPADEFISLPGRGVRGRIGQEVYLVGNEKLLTAEGINLSSEEHVCGTGTLVYVVRDTVHLGTLILGDSVRQGAIEAITELEHLGIHTVMLTGDNESIAKTVAEELSIGEYYAGLLPEQKVEKIQEFTSRGSTAMVGDGINDTPALVASDVGIAMGVISSDATIETADVTLMDENLRRIPRLIQRAKRTMSVVKQNVTVSITAKLFVGFLAVTGFVSLWMAILFGDMGLTLVVILNALRLGRRRS